MADHRMYAAKGLAPATSATVASPISTSAPAHNATSDVDMSESQSDDDGPRDGTDDSEPNRAGEHSEAESESPVEHRPKPSRKLDLPANLDADLYGLRRSVSLKRPAQDASRRGGSASR